MTTLRAVPPAFPGGEDEESGWLELIRRVAEHAAELRSRQDAFQHETEGLIAALTPRPPADRHHAPLDLRELLLAYERSLVRWALALAEGNQRRAAELLGLRATTLNEKMKRLGIGRPNDFP